MTTTHDFGAVRHDIFGVQVYDHSAGGWCWQHMTTTIDRARELARDANRGGAIIGRSTLVRIAHPRERVVEAFLAFGNQFR